MKDKDPSKRGPRPLAVSVELIQDVSAISAPLDGYLRRHRHRVKTRLTDGTRSELYVVDYMDRRADQRDAVGVIVFARPRPGLNVDRTPVLLRRQVRYGAYVATGAPLVAEVIAGLIEGGESAEATAVRELREEAGIEIDLSMARRLGRPFFPLPGIFTERMVAVAVELPEETLHAAAASAHTGDGSAFEQGAEHVVRGLREAIDMSCASNAAGEIDVSDAKTELILLRLDRALREGKL